MPGNNGDLGFLVKLSYDLLADRIGAKPVSWQRNPWLGVLKHILADHTRAEVEMAMRQYFREDGFAEDSCWPASLFPRAFDKWVAKRERHAEYDRRAEARAFTVDDLGPIATEEDRGAQLAAIAEGKAALLARKLPEAGG